MELDRGRGRDKAEGIIKQVSATGIELRASCSSESSGIGIKGGHRLPKKQGEGRREIVARVSSSYGRFELWRDGGSRRNERGLLSLETGDVA